MSLESGIIQKLLSDVNINSIVGARIKPIFLDQNSALPALVTNFISRAPLEEMGQASNAFKTRLQIDCFCKSYLQVLDLSKKGRLCLDYFTGTLGGETVSRISFIEVSDFFEPEILDFRRTLEFFIWHQEN